MELAIKCKEKTWKSEFPERVTTEPMIQLMFFKNDGDQRVKIVEVENISLEDLIQHLNQGESILITRKRTNKEKPALNVDEEISKPWYFTHI